MNANIEPAVDYEAAIEDVVAQVVEWPEDAQYALWKRLGEATAKPSIWWSNLVWAAAAVLLSWWVSGTDRVLTFQDHSAARWVFVAVFALFGFSCVGGFVKTVFYTLRDRRGTT